MVKGYLFSRTEIIAAYLFGSYAAGRSGPLSDIDIAVLLDARLNAERYGTVRLEIINGLIELLSCDKIDVAVLNQASPVLSHGVIKNGLLLFFKNEAERSAYVARATMRYLDTVYLRKVQDRILREKIRRGEFGAFKGSRKYSIEKVRKGLPDTPAVT